MRDKSHNHLLRNIVYGLQLPKGDLRDPVTMHLFKHLRDTMAPLSLATLCNTIVVSALFWNHVPIALNLIWAAPLVLFTLYQFSSARKFAKIEPTKTPSSRFIRKAERNIFFFGVWWGLSCWFFKTESDNLNLALAGASMGMCAAAAASVGPMVGMASRFLTGCIPVTLAALSTTQNEASLMVMTLGAALAFVLLMMCHTKYNLTKSMLQAELEVRKSLGRLEKTLEVSGVAMRVKNADGEVILENKMFRDAGVEGLFASVSDMDRSVAHQTRERRLGDRWFRLRRDATPDGDRICAAEDVTEYHSLNSALKKTIEEVEATSRSKDRFFSEMQDDLIQPLQTIMSFSKIMGSGSRVELQSDDAKGFSDEIYSEAKRLSDFLSQMMKYSDDPDNKVLHAEEVPVDELKSYLVSEMPTGTEVHGPTHGVSVLCDRTLIQRLVLMIANGVNQSSIASGHLLLKFGTLSDGRLGVMFRKSTDTGNLVNVRELPTSNSEDAQVSFAKQIATRMGMDVKTKLDERVGKAVMLIIPRNLILTTATDENTEQDIAV